MIAGISRSIRRLKNGEMAEFDLKTPHVSCIYYLYRANAPLTAKEICDLCDEDKAAISRSLVYLEKNGFIRCLSDARKRYRSPMVLTDKGNEIGAKLATKIDSILALAGEGMSDKERAEFYRCLRIIHDNLQSICDKYDSLDGDNG